MRICPECEQRFADDITTCPDDNTPTVAADDDITPESMVGRVLDGRWALKSLLGKGGMGAVYRAEQLSVQREVAVKIILPHIGIDAQMVARFFREAKVMSTMKHPNIVTMFDFGQDADTKVLYLVMELLPGEALNDLLKRREEGLTLPEILALGEQLMGALAEAHRQDIIHRDLKPQNLMIEQIEGVGMHLTLLDFGIARVDKSGEEQLTQTGMLQGTPRYMAPEQIKNGDVTARTDVYASGVLFYKLLTLQEPFEGDTLFDIMIKQVREEPAPLNEAWALQAPINVELVQLVHAMLAKDADARPESALVVRQRLKDIRQKIEAAHLFSGTEQAPSAPTPSPEPPVVAPAEPAASPSTATPAPLPAPPLDSSPHLAPPPLDAPQKSGPNLLVIAIVAVILIGGIGGAAAFFFSQPEPQKPPQADAPAKPTPAKPATPDPDDTAKPTDDAKPNTDDKAAAATPDKDTPDQDTPTPDGDAKPTDDAAALADAQKDPATPDPDDNGSVKGAANTAAAKLRRQRERREREAAAKAAAAKAAAAKNTTPPPKTPPAKDNGGAKPSKSLDKLLKDMENP